MSWPGMELTYLTAQKKCSLNFCTCPLHTIPFHSIFNPATKKKEREIMRVVSHVIHSMSKPTGIYRPNKHGSITKWKLACYNLENAILLARHR